MAVKEPWNGDPREWSDEEVEKRLAIADVIAELMATGAITEIEPGVYVRTPPANPGY